MIKKILIKDLIILVKDLGIEKILSLKFAD